jgi:hypothetical protein
MNIRLGEGAVRFRISCGELKLLLAGERLEERLTLAGRPVLLTIEPSGAELEFIYEDGHIGLRAPLHSLTELDSGRNKEGVSANTGGTALSLQVDLKTYARTKQGAHK